MDRIFTMSVAPVYRYPDKLVDEIAKGTATGKVPRGESPPGGRR